METADAVVVHDELATIPTVVGLSRRARRLVVQNLVIASVFITSLAVRDLAGALPLPLGIAGHEGSTVIVGLNGLRLLRDAAWFRAPTGGGAEPARPRSQRERVGPPYGRMNHGSYGHDFHFHLTWVHEQTASTTGGDPP